MPDVQTQNHGGPRQQIAGSAVARRSTEMSGKPACPIRRHTLLVRMRWLCSGRSPAGTPHLRASRVEPSMSRICSVTDTFRVMLGSRSFSREGVFWVDKRGSERLYSCHSRPTGEILMEGRPAQMKTHLIISPTLFAHSARSVSQTTGLVPFFATVPPRLIARPQPFGRNRRV